MGAEDSLSEGSFRELADQVRRLTARVDELSAEVEAIARERPVPSGRAGEAAGTAGGDAALLSTAGTWHGIGQTGLLSGLATVCFLLVVALVLRTITENGLVDARTGPLLGMGYAGLIMASGCILLGKGLAMGPIFAVSGTVLLFFVIVEASVRFGTLSTTLGFAVLGIALLVMGLVGLERQRPVLLGVTVLGATIAAIAMGLREGNFPWLGGILLVANWLAYKASRVRGSAGLRWGVFAATLFCGFVWADRVLNPSPQGLTPKEAATIPWLLPLMCAFAANFIFLVVRRTFLKRTPLGAFDAVSIVGSVLGAFAVAWAAERSSSEGRLWVCVAGVATALLLIAVGIWLARKKLGGVLAAEAFSMAAALLAMPAVAGLTGDALVSSLLWSALGMAVGLASIRVGPMLLWPSYVLQAAAATLAVASGSMSVPPRSLAASAGILAILSAISMAHYLLFRRRRYPALDAGAPQGGSPDASGAQRDLPSARAAVVALLASLVFAFGALRILLYESLLRLQIGAPDAFACGQSVALNLGASLLVGWALWRKQREIFAVAALVGTVGAVKVFGFDLLGGGGQGIPLVLSVFSFGLATAFGSVALRRLR